LADRDPSAPYGVVFLVERREQVEKTYQDLNTLLPGKVIAWTKDHGVACDKPEKVKNPTARSSKADLPNAPVIVVTHAFYLSSKNGHLARTVARNGITGQRQRALTIVDERPDEAPTQSITLGDAEKVREAVVERNPEIKPHMDALFLIMEQCNYGPKNQLLRPGKELPWSDVHRDLWWFQSKEAERLALANASVPGVSAFFHFAKAFVLGRGFAATDGLQATFYAYAHQTVVDRAAGTILLDATADIDGRSKVVPWIVEIPTPQASFSNLEIVVIPPLEKTQLRKYFKQVSNRRAYANRMQETIREHTAPGQKVLPVCRLALFENKNVPWWPEDDPRFNDPSSYTTGFQWDFAGRKLCATHYGTGIGSNDWKDADVVVLCDDFILPKAAAICTTQGLRADNVDEGDLGAMKTMKSNPRGVVSISDGAVLRQIRQLALRGNVRNYDEHGACGKMRLVIACDQKLFMSNVHSLFPGVLNSNIRIVGGVDDDDANSTVQAKVIALLKDTQKDVLYTREISRHLGREWRSIVHYVRKPPFDNIIATDGWKYVPGKGCKGAYCKRMPLNASKGALNRAEGILSPFM
jgi:hypothetical protein